MSYPFDLFKTTDNISIKKINTKINIFNIHNRSILKDYELEINEYIKKNFKNNDYKKFEILNNLSNIYVTYKTNNIEFFFKELVHFKNQLLENKKNIDEYFSTKNKITENNLKRYHSNLIINNPLNSKNIEIGFFSDHYFHDLGLNSYNNGIKLEKNLDILLLGNTINLTLPSIGPINNYILKNNTNNYLTFISEIVNYKDEYTPILHIPFLNLDLGEKISSILLQIDITKLGNNNYNFNNENMKKLIINMVNNIEISFENIFYDKIKKQVKKEFIIPYKIEEHKTTKIKEINKMQKNDIEKLKTYEKIVESNNKLILFVISNIDSTHNLIEKHQLLEKKNYKNILASYLFYIIYLLNQILKLYLVKIDEILKNIVDSREKRFKILNIKDAFEYTSLLNKSLLNFHKILLNNFYHLFIPTKIISGNYGMKIDENGCYIPESTFLGNNEIIIKEYPIHKADFKENIIDQTINIDQILIINFMSIFKSKNDIYNSTFILELGGNVYDYSITKHSMDILNEYYELLKKNDDFSLFIIQKVINNFSVKECIPMEFIDDLKFIIYDQINPDFEKKVIQKFDIEIKKSINFFLKLSTIRQKIKKIKQTNIHNLHITEEYLQLCFIAYKIKSIIIIYLCEKKINDTKLKNSILKKISEKKMNSIKIIKNYLGENK